MEIVSGWGFADTFCFRLFSPKTRIFTAPGMISPEQSERWSALLRETEEMWWGPGHSTFRRQTQNLFSHTLHRAVIVDRSCLMQSNESQQRFQLGDVWGRVSRVQCSWPSGTVVSSAILPSALQSVKDRAKLTQKQIISEISCYQCRGNLHWGFSMITGPECIIRLRRKLLKAHNL